MSTPDLTLWLVSPDTGAETLCLGRDAAEALSVRLMGDPSVISVSCEPVSRASEDHLWTVAEVDEEMPATLFQLGTDAGLDIEEERCDPSALLDTLRDEVALAEWVEDAARKRREHAGWRTWLAVHCCCGIPDLGSEGQYFDTGRAHGPAPC